MSSVGSGAGGLWGSKTRLGQSDGNRPVFGCSSKRVVEDELHLQLPFALTCSFKQNTD